MKNYKTFCLLAALILVFGLLSAGCGSDGPAAAPSESEPTEQVHTEEALTAVMTAEELNSLDDYPNLKQLDLSGSTCYDAILAYIASHPQVQVTYTVSISGGSEPTLDISNTAEQLNLASADYIDDLSAKAAYLPGLKSIDLGNTGASAEQIRTLKNAFPGAIISYTVELLGQTLPSNTSTVDLSGLAPGQVDEAAEALAKLPALSVIQLMDANGECALSPSDVSKLAQVCPGAAIGYEFELFGQQVSASAESLEYVDTDIGNEGIEQIREVLPFMTRLSYLKLDKCGVDNEVMAQLRDDFPDIKVVWRIYFSGDGYNCLTDTEKIWATGTVTDGFTDPLKYCTDVKYIDMGHNCIANIDFVNYMPKLQVAVFAISWVEDISPLANCPDLEYLEIFSSRVSDLSPLANCTNLEHLNAGNLQDLHDITPLYGLTKLKRLYITMSDIPEEQQQKIQELIPDCEFQFGWIDPADKGPWRYDENGERVERYELLAQQIGYDTFDYSR